MKKKKFSNNLKYYAINTIYNQALRNCGISRIKIDLILQEEEAPTQAEAYKIIYAINKVNISVGELPLVLKDVFPALSIDGISQNLEPTKKNYSASATINFTLDKAVRDLLDEKLLTVNITRKQFFLSNIYRFISGQLYEKIFGKIREQVEIELLMDNIQQLINVIKKIKISRPVEKYYKKSEKKKILDYDARFIQLENEIKDLKEFYKMLNSDEKLELKIRNHFEEKYQAKKRSAPLTKKQTKNDSKKASHK